MTHDLLNVQRLRYSMFNEVHHQVREFLGNLLRNLMTDPVKHMQRTVRDARRISQSGNGVA